MIAMSQACVSCVQLSTIGRTYEMQANAHLGNFFETGLASLRNKGHMMKSQVRLWAEQCPPAVREGMQSRPFERLTDASVVGVSPHQSIVHSSLLLDEGGCLTHCSAVCS